MTAHLLNSSEIKRLMKPVRGDGGFQRFMKKLQGKFISETGEIVLSPDDEVEIVKKISYAQGGFESRLIAIFSRHISDVVNIDRVDGADTTLIDNWRRISVRFCINSYEFKNCE